MAGTLLSLEQLSRPLYIFATSGSANTITGRAIGAEGQKSSRVKDIAKGRTARQSTKSPAVSTVAQTLLNRRNTQAQATQRASLVAATRIVAIIPLSEDIDARACIQALGRCVDEEIHGINESTNIWTMKTSRFKTSLQFLPVPFARSFAALDAARAADYTLLLLSPTIEVIPGGDTLLRMLQAQGLPTATAAIPW
ncbi:hypothetical protein CY34DRAFT_296047 [Suillus luteus UH-Slu-Lm8-n1]|uniref:Bms1-type G domain-containing protein n=1 Tax=Suillus luteus UH-Slu-Lm8-n1 TaxID=930992 RepID=A0A0C9ZQJ3_9AGAM|nr:hypothetical protein CY34DRAFT_296047 [Suillus luteus UH-Slu-Lm8-n1]